VPGKNLADLGGLPLISYAIWAGLHASSIDRVIVTTDSEAIAQVAQDHGAEVPFLRPQRIAGDASLDIDYIRHALGWLVTEERLTPSLVVQLRPTTPLREPQVVDNAIDLIRRRPDATGLRSVHRLAEPPQKLLGIEAGWLTGLFPQDTRTEYFNLPRQAFPPAYSPNGYVDVVRPDTIHQGDTLYGSRVLAMITPAVVEVDGPEELEYLRYRVQRDGHPLQELLRQN
jgi:CMP-N,N'-diacetyllegionaminic acid synthase